MEVGKVNYKFFEGIIKWVSRIWKKVKAKVYIRKWVKL